MFYTLSVECFLRPVPVDKRLPDTVVCMCVITGVVISSQESREGHAGSSPSPGDHLHAVLRQPGRGRDLPNCLHIFQLVFGVLPGTIQRAGCQRHAQSIMLSCGRIFFYREAQ